MDAPGAAAGALVASAAMAVEDANRGFAAACDVGPREGGFWKAASAPPMRYRRLVAVSSMSSFEETGARRKSTGGAGKLVVNLNGLSS